MTKILVLCIGLISFSALADTSYTEIREYVNRTVQRIIAGKIKHAKLNLRRN